MTVRSATAVAAMTSVRLTTLFRRLSACMAGPCKSTLLKLVAGTAQPDEGTVARSLSVKMGYFAQHAMDLLHGEQTVFQSLEAEFPKAGQAPLRALAKAICASVNSDRFIELSVSRRTDHNWKIPAENGPIFWKQVTNHPSLHHAG